MSARPQTMRPQTTRPQTTPALLEGLAPASIEGGPEWLTTIREEAMRSLRERGLPGKRDEAWRFTSVRDVVDTAFAPASDASPVPTFEGDGSLLVRLVDGGLVESDAALEGVTVRGLSDVLREEPALLDGVLGALAPRTHFAALNAASFVDGVLIDVAPGVTLERPISIVHVASSCAAPTITHPRVVIRAGARSVATVIERFVDGGEGERHLSNVVAEVSVGDGARLEHVRVTEGSPRTLQLAQLAVRQGRDSYYASRVAAIGGALSRLDLRLRFEGVGAEAELDGVYHVDTGDHVDHQVRVEHAADHCTSHVHYRGLLDGKGRAVFNVVSVVERGAKGSAAHQSNRNLLLSDEASLDTKPHLEIDDDDVTASHGAAIGALDPEQLFYLRSRGIPENVANDLLTIGFIGALIDRMPHEPTRERVSKTITARLPFATGEES